VWKRKRRKSWVSAMEEMKMVSEREKMIVKDKI